MPFKPLINTWDDSNHRTAERKRALQGLLNSAETLEVQIKRIKDLGAITESNELRFIQERILQILNKL